MRVDPGAFTRFEHDGWSRAAPGYHRFFSPVTAQVVEPLLDAAHVATGATVLDLATGPGGLAARAAGRGASVIGVDIAESVVALAARLHSGWPRPTSCGTAYWTGPCAPPRGSAANHPTYGGGSGLPSTGSPTSTLPVPAWSCRCRSRSPPGAGRS
jgi:SAM-dependent methyltransferase